MPNVGPILSVNEAPPVDKPNVNSSNIGDAHEATPIDGHEVCLRFTQEEATGGKR